MVEIVRAQVCICRIGTCSFPDLCMYPDQIKWIMIKVGKSRKRIKNPWPKGWKRIPPKRVWSGSSEYWEYVGEAHLDGKTSR